MWLVLDFYLDLFLLYLLPSYDLIQEIVNSEYDSEYLKKRK